MNLLQFYAGITLAMSVLGSGSLLAQTGDQILDGIGETDLIARYTFDGNAKYWSRNNLHGRIQGTDFRFISDNLFGQVLSLPEDQELYISIPGEAVKGGESLSFTGWIFLRSAKSGQRFFDFGNNSRSHFFVAPVGTADQEGCQVHLLTESAEHSAVSTAVTLNKWTHIAVVMNTPGVGTT